MRGFPTKVIYARIREPVYDKIMSLSHETGLPMATLVDIMLSECVGIEDERVQLWQFIRETVRQQYHIASNTSPAVSGTLHSL